MSTTQASGILQARKLCGVANSKGKPWRASRHDGRAQGRARRERTKVSRQDSINDEAKVRRQKSNAAAASRKRIASDDNERRRHIVQTKKAQYSHLVSSQKIMPKVEDNRPIVYGSSGGDLRKEVAALWLQPFTVVNN